MRPLDPPGMKQVEPGCQPVSGPRLDIACEQHHHTRSFCHDAAQHESSHLRVPVLVVSCICDSIGSLASTVGQLIIPPCVRLGIQMCPRPLTGRLFLQRTRQGSTSHAVWLAAFTGSEYGTFCRLAPSSFEWRTNNQVESYLHTGTTRMSTRVAYCCWR